SICSLEQTGNMKQAKSFNFTLPMNDQRKAKFAPTGHEFPDITAKSFVQCPKSANLRADPSFNPGRYSAARHENPIQPATSQSARCFSPHSCGRPAATCG